MIKRDLLQLKKQVIALGMAGVMLGTAGCSNQKDGEVPSRVPISQSYSNVEDYYKYAMRNGEAVKLYNSQNVFILFDKETFSVEEYLYNGQVTWFGGAELYDLETEEMLCYGNGISTTYNEEFYKYVIEHNHQVRLCDIGDYVEGATDQGFYSLQEIKELTPQIEKSLKVINEVKTLSK